MINKALYGLKQSGREWNTIGSFGLGSNNPAQSRVCIPTTMMKSFQLSYSPLMTSCARNLGFKKRMFEKLDEDYGLKDQGLLNIYLGVEVEQHEDSIEVHQTKYCDEIIEDSTSAMHTQVGNEDPSHGERH